MESGQTKKRIKKLHQKKYREEFSQYLIEGEKGVREALAYAKVVAIAIHGGMDHMDLLELAAELGVPTHEISEQEAKQLKTTEHFPGMMAIVEKGEAAAIDPSKMTLVLDGIRDPGNLGTIIRSADWFGIKQVLLSSDCVDLYNPKVVRSTMGSLFHVQASYAKNLAETLTHAAEKDLTIGGLVLEGEMLSPGAAKPDFLVLGSESHGIRPDIEKLLTTRYTIPGYGQAESLNAAIAGSIALYSFTQ